MPHHVGVDPVAERAAFEPGDNGDVAVGQYEIIYPADLRATRKCKGFWEDPAGFGPDRMVRRDQ